MELPWIYAILGAAVTGSLITWAYFSFRLKLMDTRARVESVQLSEKLVASQQEAQKLAQMLSDAQRHYELTNNEKTKLMTTHAEIHARIESEKKALEEKVLLLAEVEKRWIDLFKGVSADALKQNNQSFLDLAKASLEKYQEGARGDLEKRQLSIQELMKPVKESLEKFDRKIIDLEKSRVGAYESLTQQVKHLMETQSQLKTETHNLVKALRTPVARGRWGEIQLKRVVEMAGMLGHCDFFEQTSVTSEEGDRLRPDMIVRLPGGKNIVVDAKAPLAAYLEAIEASDDESKRRLMKEHARQVRTHVSMLGKKSYFDQFKPTPEFVVLFLPGEIFFSAALENDPSLIEAGVEQNVILATPTTLIALLRAVAYGWTHEALSENAKRISDMGRELYKRISIMTEHWRKVGKSLGSSVDAYNQAMSSLETRVLVTARQFKGSQQEEIEVLPLIEKAIRMPEEQESLEVLEGT